METGCVVARRPSIGRGSRRRLLFNDRRCHAEELAGLRERLERLDTIRDPYRRRAEEVAIQTRLAELGESLNVLDAVRKRWFGAQRRSPA